MITEEKINANFLTWQKCLEKYDCYSQSMINDIGDKIKNAPFTLHENMGGAYQGAMIDIVLNHLCKIALHINENAFKGLEENKTLHSNLYVNKHMLMRVLLLQHISKAEMFVNQTQQWKAKNGQFYDFNDTLTTKLKTGERSLYMCHKYGINLSEEEYEALCIIDKNEENGDIYSNSLSMLVKYVNKLTAIDIRSKQNKKNNKEEIEK